MLAQTIVLILGVSLLGPEVGFVTLLGGATALSLLAVSDFDELYDAVSERKWGKVILIVLQAFSGQILKTSGRFIKHMYKAGSGTFNPVMRALNNDLIKISKEFAKGIDGILNFVVGMKLFEQASEDWKRAAQLAKDAYAESIPVGETGTFDHVQGEYLTKAQQEFEAKPPPYEDTTAEIIKAEMTPEDKAISDAAVEKFQKDIAPVIDILNGLDPFATEDGAKNENVFYENRFSQLAGI